MITARYHREIPQRYRLEAGKCSTCQHVAFPPRPVCPKCKGRSFETVRLSEEGKIVTFTIVRVASEKFSKQTPYAVGIVELQEGIRITTQIVDAELDKIEVGQRVKLVFRRVQEDGRAGILCYGYKAIIA
ncbi:MAG: AcaC [Bacteroidetes bacterium]|jgi:uncharacterized OB-fold protein|nr:AcaC [Bacteroidota bacterium]MDP2885621.1 Zn-ribbon domain-containing OB-fold protein [Ignavibacteria bacterium]